MDITKILNSLIAALLPAVNKAIPPLMLKEGLDPWKDVVSGTENLGEINLGICTAGAEAGYSVENMIGLASLSVTSLTVNSIDSSKLPSISGTMTLSAKLLRNLYGTVTGSITAGCSPLVTETAEIKGHVTASGVTGRANVLYHATIGVPKSCLTSLTLQGLVLSYKNMQVQLEGLGIFDEFLDPVVDGITALFAVYISGSISVAVKDALNGLIKSEMPLCLSVAADGSVVNAV